MPEKLPTYSSGTATMISSDMNNNDATATKASANSTMKKTDNVQTQGYGGGIIYLLCYLKRIFIVYNEDLDKASMNCLQAKENF